MPLKICGVTTSVLRFDLSKQLNIPIQWPSGVIRSVSFIKTLTCLLGCDKHVLCTCTFNILGRCHSRPQSPSFLGHVVFTNLAEWLWGREWGVARRVCLEIMVRKRRYLCLWVAVILLYIWIFLLALLNLFCRFFCVIASLFIASLIKKRELVSNRTAIAAILM